LEDGIDLLYTRLTPYCIRSSQYDVDDAVCVLVLVFLESVDDENGAMECLRLGVAYFVCNIVQR
jgi:hypothetical protein